MLRNNVLYCLGCRIVASIINKSLIEMRISRRISQPAVQLLGQGSKTGDKKANLISIASEEVMVS